MSTPTFRVIGLGRAGTAVHRALTSVGWRGVEDGEDVLFISTPDSVIGDVAASEPARSDRVVVHLSGSLGLDVLAPHDRRASVHPMMALPDGDVGARRLLDNGHFALNAAGDPMGQAIVDALGGASITLPDDTEARARHHAACCIAANYVTTVLGLVERVAGADADAYFDLARAAIDNVAEMGAVAALTGPVARGDHTTVDRHRGVVAEADEAFHEALITAAGELAQCK